MVLVLRIVKPSMVSILVVGEHITFRADEKLSNKLSNYALMTFGNVYGNRSKAITELLEIGLEIKPLLKDIQKDPKKIQEAIEKYAKLESEQGMYDFFDSRTQTQKDGILKMYQMQKEGTWK